MKDYKTVNNNLKTEYGWGTGIALREAIHLAGFFTVSSSPVFFNNRGGSMRADGKDKEKLENALTVGACLVLGLLIIVISVLRGGLR